MSDKEFIDYINKMKKYLTDEKNFTPAASSNSLIKAGIINKNGNVAQPYKK